MYFEINVCYLGTGIHLILLSSFLNLENNPFTVSTEQVEVEWTIISNTLTNWRVLSLVMTEHGLEWIHRFKLSFFSWIVRECFSRLLNPRL